MRRMNLTSNKQPYASFAYLYDLKNSVEEVKLAKEGKIKLQSAKDFLNGH